MRTKGHRLSTVIKEPLIEEHEKVWGSEFWLVNNDKYCAKYLVINSNAQGSLHYHPNKQETFIGVEGHAKLIIEGKTFIIFPGNHPKTILPYEKHQLIGLTDAVVLEVSTPHKETDVVRITESKANVPV